MRQCTQYFHSRMTTSDINYPLLKLFFFIFFLSAATIPITTNSYDLFFSIWVYFLLLTFPCSLWLLFSFLFFLLNFPVIFYLIFLFSLLFLLTSPVLFDVFFSFLLTFPLNSPLIFDVSSLFSTTPHISA